MLGDEVQEKAVKITYKGLSITVQTVDELIRKYLATLEKRPKETYGKQGIKKLNKKGVALDTIPVVNEDLKGLKRELNKYGVDYSVRKSVEKGSYEIYFKGRDINQIQTALKNYMAKTLKKSERPTIQERMKEAVIKAKERNENRKQKERKLERGHDER